MNRFPGQFFQMLIKDFRMFFLLICGKAKDCLNDSQTFFLRLGSAEGVAVSGLTFSRKSSHKVFTCFTFFKICTHMHSPFLPELFFSMIQNW